MKKTHIAIIIFIIISLFIFILLTSRNIIELFIGQRLSIEGQTFQKIGNGPAIDKTVMTIGTDGLSNPWQSDNNLIPYRNHEGHILYLKSEQFRNSNGFIPPSFEFFPFGIDNDSYKPEDTDFNLIDDPRRKGYNTEEGRNICLKACKDTNCIAVQTEVPQLCYTKRTKQPVPEGFDSDVSFITSKGDCKGRATHGCTLFYRTLEDADDAFYNLSGGEDALNNPNNIYRLGQKYYENNMAPSISPGKGLPSEQVVKWCPSNVTRKSGVASRYETIDGATSECSCVSGIGELPSMECGDPNCCVFRDLLTTDFSRHNTPYYSLPLNLTKTRELENNSLAALCPAKDNNDQCCGICPDPDNPGQNKLVSCPQNRQYLDGTFKPTYTGLQTNQNIWWGIDVNAARCSPKPNIESWLDTVGRNISGWLGIEQRNNSVAAKSEDECIQEFQELYNSDQEAAYNRLQQCCGFLDQSCMAVTVQPFCSTGSGDVVNGCFGDPRILNVDRVLGEIGSCDDPSVISNKNRCIQDVDGKLCKAFPFGCDSGPLWKPI